MIEENRNSIAIYDVDFDSDQYKRFERNFSVYDTVRHKYAYNVYATIGDSIRIPASVGSDVVRTYFYDMVVYKKYNVPTSKVINFTVKHKPRDTIQQESLAFLSSMKNDSDHSRMLNLATGSGKTYVAIATIALLQKRAMIVVDTIDLAEQWKNKFLFHTDIDESEILIISGKESLKNAENSDNYKVFIAIHKTLGMLMDEDINSMNQIVTDLGIGVRVFDECHVNFHNICMINALSNVDYTIYLTATPNRSDYKEDLLYSKVFNKVKSFDGHKSENEKYHKVVLANFNSNPTEVQKLSVKTKYGFSMMKWANFLETSALYTEYKKSLFTIIDKFKLVENNKKFAIMLPTIKLIEKTYDDIVDNYENVSVGKFIGDIRKKEERQEQLDKSIIITNDKMFGKAIDVPDLDCLINYLPVRSQVNTEQIMGRLRNSPGHTHVLIDVTDIGFTECKISKNIRKKLYRLKAKEIIEINDLLN